MTCLFIAFPVQGIREGYGAEGCSPEGFDTIVELPLQGSDGIMRFVRRGSGVNVYVYEPATSPDDAQG